MSLGLSAAGHFGVVVKTDVNVIEPETPPALHSGAQQDPGKPDPDIDDGGDGKSRELPVHARTVLKEWLLSPEHFYNPYPTPAEKDKLIAATGIQMKQLTNWFTNARKRVWKPLLLQALKKDQSLIAVQALETQTLPTPADADSDEPKRRNWQHQLYLKQWLNGQAPHAEGQEQQQQQQQQQRTPACALGGGMRPPSTAANSSMHPVGAHCFLTRACQVTTPRPTNQRTPGP
jgi:hypothetical protein